VELGIIIFLSFFSVVIFRPLLHRIFIEGAKDLRQPRRAFIVDFLLCITAGIIVSFHNWIVYDIPPVALTSLFSGCFIAGFFIGLDSALNQERKVIIQAIAKSSFSILPKRFYPLTRRFIFIAIATSIIVSIVLILVFTRDVEWLTQTVITTEEELQNAQLSVIYEILFIMSILVLLIGNLIFSYSRNLKLLFDNQTQVLEQVRKGDLTAKVPVATNDEFGVIASHTNHMIDGLRHRFELINSLKLAEEVQQNLLPDSSPYLENFAISGTSIYCEQTGGDYFDYFVLSPDKMAIVVADACGHGVGAALLMSSVRAYITSAISGYTGPARLLEGINRQITRDCSKTSRFTSMFFLEIDHQKSSIRWVRAGHEPPLYYSGSSGLVSRLEGAGLVLGIDSSYHYQEFSKNNLQRGDIILVGTDGISETTDKDGLFFGEERLADILKQNADSSPRQIQERIIREVEIFRDKQPQEDDITLVVIKVR
jgi:sigma-B regulation protein RsbU (phosphoserine phosphatase)